MKTRTNQPVFYDNGQRVDDSALGVKKEIIATDLHFDDNDYVSFSFGSAETIAPKLMEYDLLLFTCSLSTCIFIAPTQEVYLSYGLLGLINLPVDAQGNTRVCKCRIEKYSEGRYVRFRTDLLITEETPRFTGTLIGIKL